jgi:large subunit ribosomal protein L25
MAEVVFQAISRQVTGKQVRALRREGRLPAVIYGHNIGSIAISLDFHEASYVLPGVSSSHVVQVVVDGKKEHAALVRERQRHPVTGALLHVDFQAISMTEKLHTSVSIELTGTAPAVRDYDGILVAVQEEVEVESLPGDLPERIKVDISGLKEIGDAIRVRDLSVPEGVEILTEPEEIVVVVTAPTAVPVEEVEEEVEEEVSEAEPEVIEKGKREEEEY